MLRTRLALWYTLAMAVTLLIVGGLLLWHAQRSLLEQMDTGLQLAAEQSRINVDVEAGRLSFRNEGETTVVDKGTARGSLVRLQNGSGLVWASMGQANIRLPDGPPVEGFRTIRVGDEDWRLYSEAIQVEGVEGWLEVAASLNVSEEALELILGLLSVVSPLALLLSALGGLFIADRALRPIAQIASSADAIDASRPEQGIEYSGPPDEVGRLAGALNRMLERLSASIERERRFTSDVSHELRTPLTALKGQIEVTLRQARSPQEYQAVLLELQRQVDRLASMSGELLLLARLDDGLEEARLEDVDLARSCEDALGLLRTAIEDKQIAVRVALAQGSFVRGQQDLVLRILLNLIENALRYSPAGASVTISAERQAGRVCLRVSDTGPGIAADHLPQLFDRFYRVEAHRARARDEVGHGGSGLGLSIAREIARKLGGDLKVDSALGEGTTMILWLPEAAAR
jgi:heavy metal sensor kinase